MGSKEFLNCGALLILDVQGIVHVAGVVGGGSVDVVVGFGVVIVVVVLVG